MWQHKTHSYKGFTDRYGCTRLVWFEQHELIIQAIHRERRIKKWLRDWKLALIERGNPTWKDLAADWYALNDADWTAPVSTE